MNAQPKIKSWMDSTTRKGTNFNFTPRLYKVTIVKWISFMAFDGKHFFLSNVLMRKCWVLIMASSCWWPILRFILVVRFNLVCLDLPELMRGRFVIDLSVKMTFPRHGSKSIDLTKTFFPIQCTNGNILSSEHVIQLQTGCNSGVDQYYRFVNF